ncbi:acetyl-CoA C-acetyltransferase [Spongiibacter taiwanensis]|uniref:acetyl-CoA C-acetyltransferase n=1 Tax=Spongiibacter taiwanensis TaxID=1748242 RepID=UPI002035E2C2|nr:acetyl-CoA C-acetyltransferase [Spongiibacter taiwanensis]USA42626.1 acetyl-CoA C-acetyltransferase [Spongiibacter taiwanensis]
MTQAFIYDAVRTPRSKGKPDGGLNEVKPVDLAAGLLIHLQRRFDLDTSLVGDVILGCADPLKAQGGAIGKTVAMQAGWAETVSGLQLDRYCGSGLEAVNIGAMKVIAGVEDMVVSGGVESMSQVPIASGGSAWVSDPAINIKTGYLPQGIGADLIATLDGYSREDVDAFALQSQQRAAKARAEGYFKSVVPVTDMHGRVILAEDDFIKPDSTMAILGSLKPSFAQMGAMGMDQIAQKRYPEVEKIDHVHTPGNSSGIVDGASAVLIGSEQIGKDLGLTPRGRIVAMANVSTEPTIMLTGPAPATMKVLKKAGLSIDDIDLFEVNEAFASVVMRFMRDTGAPAEKVNVNGGAIAMGHPLGATGGMLVGTVLDELERRGGRYGLCTLCIGAGMGIATIIERV